MQDGQADSIVMYTVGLSHLSPHGDYGEGKLYQTKVVFSTSRVEGESRQALMQAVRLRITHPWSTAQRRTLAENFGPVLRSPGCWPPFHVVNTSGVRVWRLSEEPTRSQMTDKLGQIRMGSAAK